MPERIEPIPNSEEFNQTLNGWGKKYFFRQPIEGVSGLWFAVPDAVQIVFWFKGSGQGKLTFVVKEDDLISLEYQPKEEERITIPFSGEEKVKYVDQVSVPLNGVRDQEITEIKFEHLDETISSISLKLTKGQLSLKFAKGAIGKASLKEIHMEEARLVRRIHKIMMPF